MSRSQGQRGNALILKPKGMVPMSISTSHHVLALPFGIALSCCCFAATTLAADWPQWRGEHRDGTWHETGLVKTFAAPVTTPLWSVPISAGYSQPTVAQGRVFLTDRLEEEDQERVHCFDANTGEYVNMYKQGIVDPAKVVKNALINAASIAGLMLTTQVLVTRTDDMEGGEKTKVEGSVR